MTWLGNHLGRYGLGYVAAAVCFGGLVECSTAEAKTLHNDRGGYMEQYEKQAAFYKSKREPLRLSGFCASACTIYLQRRWKLDICAMPGSKLMFHMPYYAFGSSLGSPDIERSHADAALAEHEWKSMFLGRYGPKLNAILLQATKLGRVPNPAAGDSHKKMFRVPARDVLPPCK